MLSQSSSSMPCLAVNPMKSYCFIPVLLCTVFSCAKNVHAEPAGFMGLSIGYFNTLHPSKGSASLSFRYEHQSPVFSGFKSLKPWFEFQVTKHTSLWAGGGLKYTIPLSTRWNVSPFAGAGLYRQGARDMDLGAPVQFKTGVEFSYILKNDARFALSFSHLSNAGLSDNNPGAETASVRYYHPIFY